MGKGEGGGGEKGEGGEGGYLEALKANSKLALADGEGVAEVEPAVHVGVGKGHHVLLICRRIKYKNHADRAGRNEEL
jgi:hypothetical protein